MSLPSSTITKKHVTATTTAAAVISSSSREDIVVEYIDIFFILFSGQAIDDSLLATSFHRFFFARNWLAHQNLPDEEMRDIPKPWNEMQLHISYKFAQVPVFFV